MMSTYVIRNGELCHHGVPGMKWGKRKAKSDPKADREKAAKEQFKADVKEARKRGMLGDYTINKKTGEMSVQFLNTKGQKVGRDYAVKVMQTAARQKRVRALVGTAVVAGGMAAASLLLRRYS